jgi:hypothetical protein
MSAVFALGSVQCTRRGLASLLKYISSLLLPLTCLIPPASEVLAQSNAFLRTPPPVARTVPEQARQIERALDERLEVLSNVICQEEIARYAKKGKETNQVDTLHLNVEVLEGVEKYSGIRRREKTYMSMQKLPGTWSVGEMATLLSATRDAILSGQIQIGRDETSELGPSSVMTFSYTAEERRWYLLTRSQMHWLPFEGRVWASPDTGEIRRITWYSKDVPSDAGVSQVVWTVDFSPVDLSPVVVTLPEKALFQVTYKNGGDRMDWNVTHFSEYRRYGSETEVHFDD